MLKSFLDDIFRLGQGFVPVMVDALAPNGRCDFSVRYSFAGNAALSDDALFGIIVDSCEVFLQI